MISFVLLSCGFTSNGVHLLGGCSNEQCFLEDTFPDTDLWK